MNNQEYKNKLIEACERVKTLGYPVQDISQNSFQLDAFFVGEKMNLLTNLLTATLGRLEPESLQGNCINVSLLIQKLIATEFNLKSYLTMGYIMLEDKKFFEFSENDIETWLQDGISDLFNINIHAWLTLESLEIIDVTFPTTISLIWDVPELLGQIICNQPGEIKTDMNFYPVIIGQAILPAFGIPPIYKSNS